MVNKMHRQLAIVHHPRNIAAMETTAIVHGMK